MHMQWFSAVSYVASVWPWLLISCWNILKSCSLHTDFTRTDKMRQAQLNNVIIYGWFKLFCVLCFLDWEALRNIHARSQLSWPFVNLQKNTFEKVSTLLAPSSGPCGSLVDCVCLSVHVRCLISQSWLFGFVPFSLFLSHISHLNFGPRPQKEPLCLSSFSWLGCLFHKGSWTKRQMQPF